MDFTRLNNEYSDFWNKHDLNGAIDQIKKIEAWINAGGADPFSFHTVEDQIKPNYLAALYSDQNGIDLTMITNNTSYSDLIDWYKSYLNTFVQQIEDFKIKTAAMGDQNILDQIIGAVVSLGSNLLYIGAGIILLVIVLRNI
jgi:hypothetical protein